MTAEKHLPAHITEADVRAVCEVALPNIMRPLLDNIKRLEAERKLLAEFISDVAPWTANESWHVYEHYRTPEIVAALMEATK